MDRDLVERARRTVPGLEVSVYLEALLLPELDRLSQVAVRLRYEEEELRKGVREAGGRWDPREKLWWLRWDFTCRLGINERVVAWRDS